MAVTRYKGKKSLKQPDEFITFSARLLQQTIIHKNKIIGALGGIVVLVAILSTVNYFSQKAEEQSLLELSQAISRYNALQDESGDADAYSGVKDDLMKIIETYGRKSGGKFANFFLANCSFAAGDFETSETLYRKSIADLKGLSPFGTLAKSSLGYTLAQRGDHDGAAAVFAELADEEASLLPDETLFALVRQYGTLGKTDLQKETARKLMDAYPDSLFTNVVQEKFPGLAASSAG